MFRFGKRKLKISDDPVAIREYTIGHTWSIAMAEPGKQYVLYARHSYARETGIFIALQKPTS